MAVGLHQLPETAHAIVSSAAGGVLAVAPALAGSRSSIYKLILVTSGAVTVTIQDTASTNLSAPYAFGASGGTLVVDTQINGDPWWQTGIGLGLQLNASAAVNVAADIYYLQRP
jgi:hypothetical protein